MVEAGATVMVVVDFFGGMLVTVVTGVAIEVTVEY